MNDNVLFEIKGLQKKFGELTVFDGLDETISKGDVVVIIGPSGGGKSTFIPQRAPFSLKDRTSRPRALM